MATNRSIATRKHPLTPSKTKRLTKTPTNRKTSAERYIVDARGKRVAVVLELAEYRRLIQEHSTTRPQSKIDWLAEARSVRALAQLSPDSTPILRDLREGHLR